jgi:7,8-dihydro-6-hydroxymethylpterin dimethyltransferase
MEAKHVIRDNHLWMHKWCPEHGQPKVLIASNAAYWRLGREVYLTPPEMPLRFNAEMHWGCPYNCGLGPDMQHSCLTVLEITDACNLACPVCCADSEPHRAGQHRDLAPIKRTLDAHSSQREFAGRVEGVSTASGRLTLREVRDRILTQTAMGVPQDIL